MPLKVIYDCQTGQQTEIEMTQEEIAEAEAAHAAYIASIPYTQKRLAEYPSFMDYIDGVVKGDQAQIQAYIDQCLAVKAKYPKPQ